MFDQLLIVYGVSITAEEKAILTSHLEEGEVFDMVQGGWRYQILGPECDRKEFMLGTILHTMYRDHSASCPRCNGKEYCKNCCGQTSWRWYRNIEDIATRNYGIPKQRLCAHCYFDTGRSDFWRCPICRCKVDTIPRSYDKWTSKFPLVRSKIADLLKEKDLKSREFNFFVTTDDCLCCS